MSKFQVILTAVFVVCIVGGVIAFATFRGGSAKDELPAITIWGTYPSSSFDAYINKINQTRAEALKITYVKVEETNFDKKFIEALARGQGPDAILIPQDYVYKYEDKIIPIPYEALSERSFRDTFIQQAELYLGKNGVLALPFIEDPLIMYWNRDTFTNAGIAIPPKYWDEFTEINKKITKKDVNSNIKRSAIALGEFNNIVHAREILGTILMQYGNPVTFRDKDYLIASALGDQGYSGSNSSIKALDFFTQFSNPSNENYSWNRSLTNTKNSFLSGNLATYFGFASEISEIKGKNPNLDFDVTAFPQIRNSSGRVVYGNMYGISIVRSAANVNATYTILSSLIEASSLNTLVSMTYLPSVRRDIIASGSTDPYLSIFNNSALVSRNWLDIGRIDSNKILQNITELITSGRKNAREAIQSGSEEFNILLNRNE
jgi:ABC-type glycerol-3-phosphate transport system substrate-binding protein